MEHTETLIVEQLKIGNEDAYQYIYDRHYALLCHVASGYVKDQFLAETIVGDTIFHLWEIRETLEISVSIRSYLVRAVRNRCINYLNSEWEKREIAFSSLMPDEITDDKMTISDSHPLGALLERELEEEKKHIDELIATYLTEGLDKNALAELKAWIAASPENKNYFIQQREVWFSAVSREAASKYNKDKAFDTFKKRIGNRKEIEKTSHHGFRLSMLWRYAAIIAVILAVGCFSYWQGGVNVKDTFADISVEAPLGSRTKLYLPDGTLVWLNAGSRMTYSQGFGVDNRMIELEGEGYFEVRRNEKLPFFVKTKDLQLQVLGTKFNFRDYPEDHEVVVSLLEGKVELNNLLKKEKEAILAPDERAILNKTNGRMTVETVTASNASQWTDGYLFFDEELLPDIVKELERSYNVTIRIANDSLNTFRFYGNFVRREQSIQEVLDALASTEKIQYKIEERNITIY